MKQETDQACQHDKPSDPSRSRTSRWLDLILPPLCIYCRLPIRDHGQLCARCWSKIHFITAPLCDVTGLPLPFDSNVNGPLAEHRQISAKALAQPPLYDRARSVAMFGDVSRGLVHGLKYGDQRAGLPLFGRWMAQAGHDLLRHSDLIVPVPLYRFRLWQRRFNQSALLAFELGRLSGIKVDVLSLKRRRSTRSQVGLSENQRRKNVSGAFQIAPAKQVLFAGKTVLLVDDVLTTGATVDACARALKKAGAIRVNVLVLARAGKLDGPDL